jgi:hypothetical protein
MKTRDAQRCPSLEELSTYQGGALHGYRHWEVREHVDTCTRCRQELLALLKVGAVLTHLPDVPLPSDLWHRVATRLAPTPPRSYTWLLRLGLGTACIVALALMFWTHTPPTVLPPIPASHMSYVTDAHLMRMNEPLTDRVALGVELAGWQGEQR